MTDHFLQSCRCGVYLPDTAEQPRDAACTCRECGQAYVISPVQQLSSIVWVLTSLVTPPMAPKHKTASIRTWMPLEVE